MVPTDELPLGEFERESVEVGEECEPFLAVLIHTNGFDRDTEAVGGALCRLVRRWVSRCKRRSRWSTLIKPRRLGADRHAHASPSRLQRGKHQPAHRQVPDRVEAPVAYGIDFGMTAKGERCWSRSR